MHKNISIGSANYILTFATDIDTYLCMKGKVRSKEKCPKCKGKYEGNPLHCPACMTTPRRYYIDLYHAGYGKTKIYSDKMGHPLDSYQRAARVLEAIRYEIDQHIFDPTKYVSRDLKEFTFETRVEAWLQSKLKEVEKGHLAASYTRKIKCYIDDYYLPFFKGLDVRDIRTYHIHQFYEKMPTKSAKYTKNIISALENLFNTLLRNEHISSKLSFPVIKLGSKAPKWINIETQLKMLERIPAEDRDIFALLSFQGVRPGEGMAVKVMDFDFDEGSVTIKRTFSDNILRERVKSQVVRPRLINPVLLPMLKELCRNKLPDSFLFINPRTGRPYTDDALFRIWDKARKDAGIDITLYQATRHSVGSIAGSNGASLIAIQNVLGHTDIRTTLKYTHADLKSQEAVFEKQILTLRPQTGPKTEQGTKI